MKLKVLDFKEWKKKIMAKKEFFDHQSDLTASKILIYRQYISSYLAKVLMQKMVKKMEVLLFY